MTIHERLSTLMKQPAVVWSRAIIGEVAVGLAMAFLALGVWEMVRPGAVSPFLDLNAVLVIAIIAWLVGRPRVSLGSGYASAALFAILVGALGLELAAGDPWMSVVSGLAAVILWLLSIGWPSPTSPTSEEPPLD